MHRTKRVKSLSIFFVAVMVVSLIMTGCSSGKQGETSSSTISQAASAETSATQTDVASAKKPEDFKGEIEVWSWSESEVKTLGENFSAVYPNVKLKYVPVDNGDVNVKLQAAAASNGHFPDIAYQEASTRGKIFSMNIWENLAAAPYNMDKSLVFDQLQSQMQTADGQVLGVDREFNPSGFVYRRSLAKKYLGTDDPNAVSALISDWDKFVEAGKQVRTKSGGKVYMLAGLDDINWMLSGQYTDPIFEGDTAHLTKYFTHMFTPMVKIRDAGIAGVMKRWTPAWNASYNDGNTLFYEYAPWSGTAALKPNAPDTSGDWTVIKATGGAYTMGGTAYGIPKNAKNKDLAWEFIRWTLLTPEGAKACVDKLEVVTSFKSYYNTIPQVPDKFFNGQDVNKFLMENVAPDLKLRSVSEYDGILNEVMGLIMETLSNDKSIDVNKAVKLAIDECKSKLPSTMKVE